MPFDYDIGNPIDTFLIPSYPNNERLFRTAVSGFINIEHDGAEGRHKFGVGNDAARNAITDWVVGSLWLNTSHTPAVLQHLVTAPSTWDNTNAVPLTGVAGTAPTLPRLNEKSLWLTSQQALFEESVPVSATPDTIALDCTESPYRYSTIVGDTQINIPINVTASYSTTLVHQIIMNGTGNHAITWGAGLHAPSGIAPVVATGANTITLLYLTRMQGDDWCVTAVPDILDIA